MAIDFQTEIDTMFFDEDSGFSELVTGVPNGGTEISLYANIERFGPEIARRKGGMEQSFKQISIWVSKTDWPVVTKNKDVFTLSINGSSRSMRVVTILHEDSVSYRLALI